MSFVKSPFERLLAPAFAFCLLVSFSSVSIAQATAPRDAQSVSIVQAAVAALGGSSVIQNVSDSEMSGTCQLTPKSGTSTGSMSFTWTTEGGEFRYDDTNAAGTMSVRSGHGSPVAISSAGTNPLSSYSVGANLPYHMPALLLNTEFNDPSQAMTYLGTQQLSQGLANVVAITRFGTGAPILQTTQKWFFLQSSSLPVAVDFGMPTETAPTIQVHFWLAYSGFVTTGSGGIMVPTGLTYNTDLGSSVCTTSSTVNASPPSSYFDASGGN